MVEIRHQLPGRLRVHLPVMRSDPGLTQRLPQQLRQLNGVRTVRANPACASLVIGYHPERLSSDLIRRHLLECLEEGFDGFKNTLPLAPAQSVVSSAETLRPSRPGSNYLIQIASGFERRTQGGWLRLPDPLSQLGARLRAWWRPVESRTPSPAVTILCRTNLRLSRWMLKQTLRCWWNGELSSVLESNDKAAYPRAQAASLILGGSRLAGLPDQRRALATLAASGDNAKAQAILRSDHPTRRF